MIERKFISQKLKEFQIQEYVGSLLRGTGYSHTEIQRTPLGEKVIVYTTRPGVVVGKKGENINKLTAVLKKKFKMENPQIEIGDVHEPMLDVNYLADRIASTLERFGSNRFKSIGYKTLQNILDAGALGAEIVIAGKVPSARAKMWRFKAGYLKKSGDIAENFVQKGQAVAKLKSGIVGIKVSLMLPDIKLPDKIIFHSQIKQEVTQEVKAETPKVEPKEEKPKRKPRQKKAEPNKEEKKEEIKAETPKVEAKSEVKTESKVEIKNGNNKEK